jgi:hypothetical protein
VSTPRAAALAALLALAGCHDEDELTVVNAGSEAVLLDLSWDEGDAYEWYDGHHHRLVELPPGAIYHDDLGTVGELDVVIVRKSDGLILFADEFDAEDFDDDHGHVEITVTP